MYSLNAEAVSVSIADMHSTYDYGVQYPETLQSYSEAARLQAVKEAVDRLYKPRAELDTGVIPTDLIRGVSGFPTFLPGMNITFLLDDG